MRYFSLLTSTEMQLWLAASTGISHWQLVPDLRSYCPRQGDRLVGFFSVSELQVLNKRGVVCLTPQIGGQSLPDEATGLRLLSLLTLQTVAIAVPDLQTSYAAGFAAGWQALVKARELRATRQFAAATPAAHGA